MPLTLTVTAGPHIGRAFTFDRHDTFLVGRAAEAHFSLPDDPYFSRMHFLVEINPPLCRLTDLNSHNGTLVNGQKVQTADLRHGDEVRGGKTAIRVSVAVPAAATLDMPAPLSPMLTPVPPMGGETLDQAALHRSPPPLPDTVATCSASLLPALPGYRLLEELGAAAWASSTAASARRTDRWWPSRRSVPVSAQHPSPWPDSSAKRPSSRS